MEHNELHRLIAMANQIGRNSFLDDDAEVTAFIETHIQRFWSRRMKSTLVDYAKADGSELDSCARNALLDLQAKTK